MPEKHLFEYSVIRVVPRVEREEFLNAGVILYCPSRRFLGVRYQVDGLRLSAFCPTIDLEEISLRLQAFERVCRGGKGGGPIGALPLASRFRWLAATRSTIVQSSPVHPGLCLDPEETLERLLRELVM